MAPNLIAGAQHGFGSTPRELEYYNHDDTKALCRQECNRSVEHDCIFFSLCISLISVPLAVGQGHLLCSLQCRRGSHLADIHDLTHNVILTTCNKL